MKKKITCGLMFFFVLNIKALDQRQGNNIQNNELMISGRRRRISYSRDTMLLIAVNVLVNRRFVRGIINIPGITLNR